MTTNINLLYLAKYAPQSIDSTIPFGIEDKLYAEYHHDIYKALSNSFFNIQSCSSVSEIIAKKPKVDFIFSLYNRLPFKNSEIFISSLAEYYNIPYLGAAPNIRAIAEDKQLAKIVAKHLNIRTANWCVCNVGQQLTSIEFDGPYFVKPRFGASSKDITNSSYCETFKDLKTQVYNYHSQKIDVIIEQYIKGLSITVPILNNFGETLILPIVNETSTKKHNIITYKQKRKIEGGFERCINTDKQLFTEVSLISKKFFETLQPLDYTRIDFIIEEKTQCPFFVEFNVCCNLGKHAAINIAANNVNINYQSLIDNITFSSLFRSKVITSTFGKKF